MSFVQNSCSTFNEILSNSSVSDTMSQERQKRERERERDGRPYWHGFLSNSFLIEFVKKAVVNLRG